jgi:hypothetical protein
LIAESFGLTVLGTSIFAALYLNGEVRYTLAMHKGQQQFLRMVFVVILSVLVGSTLSCKKSAMDSGLNDVQALGAGIGRELCSLLSPGDHVIVFGMPGAVGYAAEIERESLKGMAEALKRCDVTVRAVTYLEDEIQAYFASTGDRLFESFASAAFRRASGETCHAVVSLVGAPSGSFIQPEAVLVLVEWNPEIRPGPVEGYGNVVHVIAQDFSPPASGIMSIKNSMEEALVRFDQRFRVEKRTP